MAQLTLDTVFLSKLFKKEGQFKLGFPTFTITGGTADLYVSNSQEKPTGSGSMLLNTAAIGGIQQVSGDSKWILFTTNTGTPVVEEANLVELDS